MKSRHRFSRRLGAVAGAFAICTVPALATLAAQTTSGRSSDGQDEAVQIGAFGRGATGIDAEGVAHLQEDASWFYAIVARPGRPATTLAVFRQPDGTTREVFSGADDGGPEAGDWLQRLIDGLDLELPTVLGRRSAGGTWSQANVQAGHHAHRMDEEESFAVWLTGSIELTDDRRRIERAAPGSSFVLLHQNGADATVRLLDVSATTSGATTVRYAADGISGPLDTEAHRWLADLLPRLDAEGLLAGR